MGYYILKRASDGQWMFNLHAPNHQVIATSECYTSKQRALNGIASVQKNGPTTDIREV